MIGENHSARGGKTDVVVGIVLAAGRSRRFGAQNKLLAKLHGVPLASYSARAMTAAPVTRRVAIVSDPQVGELFQDFEVVQIREGLPQSASLHSAVSYAVAADADRILVTLADMPLPTPKLLAEVDRKCVLYRASASTDGTHRSPPAGFSKECFPRLMETTGDGGGVALIRELAAEALVFATGLLADVDTVKDLEALETGPSR